MELLTTFKRVAIEHGRTEGLQLGKQEGLQQGLLVLLSTRFGLLPERTTQWVRSLTDIERL